MAPQFGLWVCEVYLNVHILAHVGNGFFPCELVLGKLIANLSATQTIKVAEERDQSLLRGETSDMVGYLF